MSPLKILTAAAALAAFPTLAADVTYSVSHLSQDGSNIGIIDTTDMLGIANFTVSSSGPAGSPSPIVTIKGVTALLDLVGCGPATGTFLYGDMAGHIYRSSVDFAINSAGGDHGVASGVTSSAASNLYGLVYDGIHTSGDDVALTITLSGLVIGKSYELQSIFSADNGAGNIDDRLLYFSGNPPPSEHPDGGMTNGNANLAYGPTSGPGLVKAYFTADSTTQTFTFSNIDENNERASLSAIILTVPEASSSALLMLGAGAILVRRRR